MKNLVTNLQLINSVAVENAAENDDFRIFLKNMDSRQVDIHVHQLNNTISPQIDCTQCGNCCKSLMINITTDEATALATHLDMDVPALTKKYIEKSNEGQLIMNTIPCHFLKDTSCSIYQNRFTECREFPHLHKENFTSRLFGTLQYYAICPIIFNVVEALKTCVGFKLNKL